MRTFVRLRQILATHKDIAEKLQAVERQYDKRFKVVFEILHRLMEPPPEESKRPIGFMSGGRKRLDPRTKAFLERSLSAWRAAAGSGAAR